MQQKLLVFNLRYKTAKQPRGVAPWFFCAARAMSVNFFLNWLSKLAG
jgi:hypothetical protein